MSPRHCTFSSRLRRLPCELIHVDELEISGQVSTGTIVGTVTDLSGGNVASVSVTITDARTGLARKVVSGSDGTYVAPNLKPGEYRVSAAAPGFNTQTIQRVLLQVDERARVDILLQVGDVTQQVTVDATAQIIVSENATAGVQRSSANAAFYDESGGSFSANGTDPGSSTTMVDGVLNMEFGAGRLRRRGQTSLIEARS